MMKVYGESLREFQGLPVTRQIMVLASQWTAGVDSFQKAFQPDPVLVFASRLEAAVQGKVQQVSVMFFLMMCLSFGLSFLLHSPSPTLPLLLLSFISSSTPLLFHYQLFHPTSPFLSALPPHFSFLISSPTPLLLPYQLFHPTSPSLSALPPYFSFPFCCCNPQLSTLGVTCHMQLDIDKCILQSDRIVFVAGFCYPPCGQYMLSLEALSSFLKMKIKN